MLSDTVFKAAWRAHRAKLRRLAYGMLNDDALADDVVQMTFTNLYRWGGRYDPNIASGYPYLKTILVRVIGVVLRKRAREESSASDGVVENAPDPVTLDAPAWTLALEQDLLLRRIRSLKPKPCLSLILTFFGGFSNPQAATLTADPVNTYAVRLCRALQQLKQLYKECRS